MRATPGILFLILITALIPVETAEGQSDTFVIFSNGEREVLPSSISTQLINSDPDSREAVVLLWYSARGFLDVSVDSSKLADTTQTFYLTTGCRYLFADPVINYSTDVAGSLFIPQISGVTFTADALNNFLQAVLSELEQSGFMMAEGEIRSIHKDSENCSIHSIIDIHPGNTFNLSGLLFDGLQRNNPDFLNRVASVNEGELITPQLGQRIHRNLTATDLFNRVTGPDLVFVNNEAFLRYSVEEQQLNFFDALLGYVPDAAGKGQIMGSVEILLRNAVTDGSQIDFSYEQLQPLVSRLYLGASQSYPASLPVRIGASIAFSQQDSTYLLQNGEFRGGYFIGNGFELIGNVRYERVVAGESVLLTETTLNSRTVFYGLGFRWRELDRILIPTRGYDVGIMLENGRKFINDDRLPETSDDRIRQTILRSSVRLYRPIANRHILAVRLESYLMQSAAFLITDLERFGGAKSMRGYREEQFRASRMGWGDLEYRYLLDRSSYIFGFGALGQFQRPQLITETTSQQSTSGWLKSLGFGLGYTTPIGLIKFSYAVSPDDDLSNGKVHISITSGL
jgi:outer membrane protein assembly factor BamA